MKCLKALSVVLLITLVITTCSHDKNELRITGNDTMLEMENSMVKVKFTAAGNKVFQEFYAIRGGEWVLVAESFLPGSFISQSATLLFDTSLDTAHRFLITETLQQFKVESKTKERVVVKLIGLSSGTTVRQWVTLEKGKDYFHFDTEAELAGAPARLDYLLSTFTFNINHPPFFVHTPGLKFDNEDSGQNRFRLLPAQDQITGDRAFHAPAVIVQEDNLFMALVPDLNAINKYAVVSPDARRTTDIPRNIFSVPFEDDKYTMPTGLDLNVRSGWTEKPVITFGLMDNIIAHHIRYQRVNDSSMIRTLNQNKVSYGFDLFVGADVPEYSGFQRVVAHLWEMYGHPVFMNRPHLGMPFQEYFRVIDSITFRPIRSKLSGDFITSGRSTLVQDIDVPLEGYNDMGSWLQFEMDGLQVGGYRSAIPWWNDVIHNSSFWNNARDASGFFFWGEYLQRADLIDRARRIINFCLSAPRNEYGLFATLFNANSKTWSPGWSDPPHGRNEFFLRESGSYEIPTLSKTAAHLIDYYSRCEQDQRIIDYLQPYADWLLTVIDDRGAVPSYVTTVMEASPILYYSSQPASSLWFLAAYYNVCREDKYRAGAKRIAGYLEREIMPEAKWTDMEQYFSCGKKPIEFERDIWQNQVVRGNLANMWACEGFAALYEATGEEKYLKLGEQAIDYVSFSQCVWEPHFIYTAFPFGGFTADNSDNATMLDARQAEMVKPFIWYGKALGRQDLLERGIAAARSSVVLLNLPSHKENNIYRHTNIYPYGLGPENIDHEAHPQSAMRTHPSWGEGSGVFTGLAEALRVCGGVYINADKKLAVGVDGVRVEKFETTDNELIIHIKSNLFNLKLPWKKAYQLDVVIDHDNWDKRTIKINDKVIQQQPDAGRRIRIILLPDNTIDEIVPV